MTPVILLAWKRGMARIHMLHALTNWKQERCSYTSCGPSWQQQPLQYTKHTLTVTRLSENNLHLISLWTKDLPGYDIFLKIVGQHTIIVGSASASSVLRDASEKTLRWSFIRTHIRHLLSACMYAIHKYAEQYTISHQRVPRRFTHTENCQN